MAQFNNVFNKAGIYDKFFFNVKTVLMYPNLATLKAENEYLYENWKEISKLKYNCEIYEPTMSDEKDNDNIKLHKLDQQRIYETKAIYKQEFVKIVAITYATLHNDNGTLKRQMKRIVNVDEFIVLSEFMDKLYQLSSDGVNSSPVFFPTLCGFDIMNYDIPLLIKKFIFYRKRFENKELPFIIKKSLDTKPWEDGIIDILNVWKFNGFSNNTPTLSLISNYLGLKRSAELLDKQELSEYYWSNISTNADATLEAISLQSATQTNFALQIINELRLL